MKDARISDASLGREGKPLPNIVVFVAEGMGYGDLGCYGNRVHRTPNLDRLAAGGVRFTDFHSNGFMCSPSRTALLTGLYQQRVGIEYALNHHTRDFPPMVAEAYTYGHAFQKAGYATGFFGSSHTGYLPENSPLRLGFDEFWGFCGGMDHHSHVTRWGQPNWWHGEELHAEEGYASDLIADHAIDFMTAHRDRPFCIHVADFIAHFPLQGPKDAPVFQLGHQYDTEEQKYGVRTDRRQVHREMVEAMDANIGRIIARIEWRSTRPHVRTARDHRTTRTVVVGLGSRRSTCADTHLEKKMKNNYPISQRNIPLDDSWDVIVIGGGPAGSCAEAAS